MKRLLPFLLALSASLTWGQPQTSHERRYELRPDPNWPLAIELGSGDYRVVASASDSIAVVYDNSDAEAMRKVQVQIDSGHGQNHLKIAGPKSNFHAVIEVPRKTDLRIRMSAGGLRIGDVYAPLFKTTGSGKYRLHAHVGVGDLTLRTTRI
jgi:hypothetical protein